MGSALIDFFIRRSLPEARRRPRRRKTSSLRRRDPRENSRRIRQPVDPLWNPLATEILKIFPRWNI